MSEDNELIKLEAQSGWWEGPWIVVFRGGELLYQDGWARTDDSPVFERVAYYREVKLVHQECGRVHDGIQVLGWPFAPEIPAPFLVIDRTKLLALRRVYGDSTEGCPSPVL